MKKIGVKVISSLIILAVIVVGLFCYFKIRDASQLTAGSLSAKLENASDCTTQKLIYQGIISAKKGKIPLLTKSTFMMTYTATVDAGFDISKSEVSIEDGTITVAIPETEVQGITIDPKSLKFYDTSFALLKPDGKEETKKALEKAEQDAEQKAKDSELLKAADENAEVLVKGLIMDSAKGREIVVKHIDAGE